MERSKSDVWVGLFVLVGAAAILFLALQSANLLSLSFQSTYQVFAKFDNIGGLKPRAPITPDPDAAAALERKRAALTYTPENPFHRDRVQARVELPMLLRRQAG